VAAVALCAPATQYSLAYPMPFSFTYPTKRFYAFKDMCAIASQVVPMIGGVPATTVDYWLRKAELVPQGRGPRSATYTGVDIEYFLLYCLCKRCYENPQEANRVYEQLSN
jgi:hypothetical protein